MQALKLENDGPTAGAHIADASNALKFILAGAAHVTFVSHKTGARFTYKVEANSSEKGPSHFVSVLTGPDFYTYLGCIFGSKVYSHGRRSKVDTSAPSAKAFPWVFARLLAGRVPETCDVHHEGRCGACGRRLTTPESILSGIGPICAGRMG